MAEPTIAEIKQSAEQKMGKTLDALRNDLAKVRTGRAHTGILDHVMVDYYGNPTPVPQVANVSLVDSRTLGVQPYEKNMVAKIEKAIRDGDLGLNPAAHGDIIRVPMPSLTEERRTQDEVQKLTDKFIGDIDKMLADKEKDLLAV
ncbi:MAG: ribosome-recycling factor [Gammaproteobacteria bacterium]